MPSYPPWPRVPRLAGWQERLTLGAGDQVNPPFTATKEMTRTDVAIGPDGRLSYLQVQGIPAAGLTIDELRDVLSRELSVYYRNARVIVTPSSFRSKKYFLMGTVIDRGALSVDRPMTIIEAIARARGIATGLLNKIPSRSPTFSGNQKRVPRISSGCSDMGISHRTFRSNPATTSTFLLGAQRGLRPGFGHEPGNRRRHGPVQPGRNPYHPGGFTLKAYRQKVLVVRGSLSQPETFVINVADVLRGTAPDFPLLPKDIVYVADRPWARAEDLLDMAITAFATTAVNVWAGQNIGPFITSPIIPSIK